MQQDRYFIDPSLKKVIPVHKGYFASTFRFGVALLVMGYYPNLSVKIIDREGEEILDCHIDTILNEYVPRDDFPLNIKMGVSTNWQKKPLPYVEFTIKSNYYKEYVNGQNGWKYDICSLTYERVYLTHEDFYSVYEIKRKTSPSVYEILLKQRETMQKLGK